MNLGIVKTVVKAAYWWGSGNLGLALGLKAAQITKAKSITKACTALSGVIVGDYIYEKTKDFVDGTIDDVAITINGVVKVFKGE